MSYRLVGQHVRSGGELIGAARVWMAHASVTGRRDWKEEADECSQRLIVTKGVKTPSIIYR